MFIFFRSPKAPKGDLEVIRNHLAAHFQCAKVTYEDHRMLPIGLEDLVKESLVFITIWWTLHFHLLGRVEELIVSKARQNQRSCSVQRTVVGSSP